MSVLVASVIACAPGNETAQRSSSSEAIADAILRWERVVDDPLIADETRARLRALLDATRETPSIAGTLGLALHGCDRVRTATECYELALDLDGTPGRWLRALALARFDLGELELATDALKRELDQARADDAQALVEPLLLLADLALRTDRLDDAHAHFQRALELEPGSGLALGGLGRVALLRDLDQDAERWLREALRSDPGLDRARHDLASVLRRRGDTAEVARLLAEANPASSDDPWLSDALRNEILGQRDDAELLARRASAAHRSGRHEEALDLYRRALRAEPEIAQNRYNVGVVLQSLGRHEEAIAEYTRFVAQRPEHAEGWNNLGLSQLELERVDDAEASIRLALERAPGHASYLYNLGLVLSARGQTQDAERAFLSSLDADADHVRARLRLAVDAAGRGDQERSIRLLLDGLRRTPDSIELLEALLLRENASLADGPVVRGVAQRLTASGLDPAALSLLRESLQRGNDWRTGVTLAALLVGARETSLRDPAAALQILEPICSGVAAEDPIALDCLARTLVALGRIEEAITTEERALELARSAGETALERRIAERLNAFRATRAGSGREANAAGSSVESSASRP